MNNIHGGIEEKRRGQPSTGLNLSRPEIFDAVPKGRALRSIYLTSASCKARHEVTGS